MKAFGEKKFDTACLGGLIAGNVMAEKPSISLAIMMTAVRHVYTYDAGKAKVSPNVETCSVLSS